MTQASPPVPPPTTPTCYRHPGRETGVRCVRCDRPICPDCMNEASVGFQCPECVAQGRRTQRAGRTVFGGSTAGAHGYVTITLIVLNVIVEVVSIASAQGGGLLGSGPGGVFGGSTPLSEAWSLNGQSIQGGVLVPSGVAVGEYYRIVTSMFVHYGILHVLFNMWALWVIGRTIEAALGPLRFLALYLLAGIGGSVAVYLFTPDVYSAGASGAIFGLFAALFVLLKRLKRDVTPLIPLIVVNVLISLAPGISLAAHAGGAVIGAIVALVFAYAPPQRRVMLSVAVTATLVVLFTVAVVVQTNLINSQGYVPL